MTDELKAAAEEHADSEGNNGNAALSFEAGALWRAEQDRAEIERLRDALKSLYVYPGARDLIGPTKSLCSVALQIEEALKGGST